MASLVTKEVEALKALTAGQDLNSEQVGYLTRLANTEFGRQVLSQDSGLEPQFVEQARNAPQQPQRPQQPAAAPTPQQSAAQEEVATAPLPSSALATLPAGVTRIPSFFSPRSAPVQFDDAIDIDNPPASMTQDQFRRALNAKASDPLYELTESQNTTRMRLNDAAGDEIDRAFIAANQAIPGLANLVFGAAKEFYGTMTGTTISTAIGDYVSKRMMAQGARKGGPQNEQQAQQLEAQADNAITQYADQQLQQAATTAEALRKTYINTRSIFDWAKQFNDSMQAEGRKRDLLRDNLIQKGVLRDANNELLSPDQRRSLNIENEVILQREWEARKAGEVEDPALDAASKDEEYSRKHQAYLTNKELERANLGINRFVRGGEEVDLAPDIRFGQAVRFPSPVSDRLITPLENTATIGSIVMDPFNIAGGVLGATSKWRLLHRTASALGKPLTGIERGAAGIRAAAAARREARIAALAEKTGTKPDMARAAYERSTRGLYNFATGGSVGGFGLGLLMSKDENLGQFGDALMVGSAILPALRATGFVARNVPKVAGVGGIVFSEAKAGPLGSITRTAANPNNHADVIRMARPASAKELLDAGVVPPQYAQFMRTYTDRAGNLNMAGGAARGADSTLKRVAQNTGNPENVRRLARLADSAGVTSIARALDDVVSGSVAGGVGVAPFTAIAPEPEQAGGMIGGAVAFGGAGGFISGRVGRASEALDADIARTMVDLNSQGADVGTLFSLPRPALETIVNIQGMAANNGVDLVLLRDEDYRANLPDVSQGTHMVRAGNVKHAVQEGDTLDSLARRYYSTPDGWRRIVAANEGKIAEGQGLVPGMELEMPGDNRWRMFVNMGHYSLEGGTVRVAKNPDGNTKVSVVKDDGTEAYSFQTPDARQVRVKDGQKVGAYEPLTNKIDRSLVAMHEFGHEVMRSDMFDGEHRIELRAIIQQMYKPEGIAARKRDYAGRMVEKEIESGVSEGVEFEFANEQERQDVLAGRVTIAQLRRQRGQQTKSKQELIDEKVAELDEDSVTRAGSPDAWVQDEIINETLASEVNALELSRIRRGQNPEFLNARAGEAAMNMTGRLLEFFGVRLDRGTGKPLDRPSTIFRENPLMKDPILRKRLLEYVRDYDRYLVGLEDAGSANAKGARMAKSDSAEDFGNSPLVTLHLNPETGRMENAFLFRGEDGKHYFKEQKDIDKAYRSQKEQVRNMVRSEGNRKVTPGSSGFGIREDDAGRTFVGGPVLPKSFDSLIRVPEHLRNFARALEQGRDEGKSWIIQNHFVGSSDGGSYKLSRVRASGRTIPREAVFIDWKVTGADNILGVFFDLDAFRAATMKAINGSELELFNNSMDTVQEKLMQYLGNHRNGRGGATGLDADPSVATAMRDTLNGLIGTGTAVQRAANPFLSGLNPRGSVRTFRLDRIDDIKPSGRTGIHFDYDKVKGNKMPNTNNRMPQQIPREARGMPDVAASGRGDGMPDRKSLQQRAKDLGLPATGTTKEIARMVGIGEKSPYEWTREEFNEIAPHLSVHQDIRPGSDARAQQIMERGLQSGMVDSVGAWGRNHTWAGGKMAGDNAYLFVSSKLKYRPGNLNPWLDEGNIPIARIKTKPGQTDIYEALIASRPQATPSASPRAQAMPDSLESVPTDQLQRQYEENQGYLGLSTLGMREGRPVRGGAAQTRELLRRNEAISAELERRGVRSEDAQLRRALQRRGQAMPDAQPAGAAETLDQLKRSQFIPTRVAAEVVGGFPEYLRPVAQFITDQRQKLASGQMTRRDVMKAYVMTVASQGSGARAVEVIANNVAKDGIKFRPSKDFTTADKQGRAAIRPEEAAAYWLGTDAGQRALNNFEAGRYNPEDWKELVAIRKAYGDDRFKNLGAFNPENIRTMDKVLADLNASRADTGKVMDAVQQLRGIKTGKKGFIAHLLGIGDVPTIDAVEINFWLTGKADIGKLNTRRATLARNIKNSISDKRVSQEMFRRIDQRINALRDEVPGGAEITPEVWSHVMHHWLWDKSKGIETTHEGMYRAQAQFMPDAVVGDEGGPVWRTLQDAPVITLKDLKGRKVFAAFADLTSAGKIYRGIDSSEIAVPIETHGGPEWPLLQAEKVGEETNVWSNQGAGVSAIKARRANEGAIMLIAAMDKNAHVSNTETATAVIATNAAYARDGRITPENLATLDNLVRAEIEDFPGIESPNIMEYVNKLPFQGAKSRARIAEILESKKSQDLGAANVQRILDEMRSDQYDGLRIGDAVLAIELTPGAPAVKLGEQGTLKHPSYQYALRGRVIGRFARPINISSIFDDFYAKRRAEGKPELGDRRAFDLAKPVQEITDTIASRIPGTPYMSFKSPRHAQLINMAKDGKWRSTEQTVRAGGVSPAAFIDALNASPAKLALDRYTLKGLQEKLETRAMSIYQLGDAQVFFGIKQGDPASAYGQNPAAFGFGPNEKTLSLVLNNERRTGGMADAIVVKALQEGVTALDCFAVKSEKYPNGMLPSLYEAYGFQSTGSLPFDPQFYSKTELADLKKYWKSIGWDERLGLPEIVLMKWRGNNELRTKSLRELAEQGGQSFRGEARPIVRDARSRSKSTSNKRNQSKRRARQGDAGAGAGSQGDAGGGVRLSGGFLRAYDELLSLSPDELRNLGIQ